MTSYNKKRKAPGKHNARIAAVQALYQMEIANRGAASVIEEFLAEHLTGQPEFLPKGAVDRNFFTRLVNDVVEQQDKIDQIIRARLSKKWRFSRIDAILRAILRCGCCELLVAKTIPTAVVVDEYVEIAKAFFDKSESGFINATLDAIASEVSNVKTSS